MKAGRNIPLLVIMGASLLQPGCKEKKAGAKPGSEDAGRPMPVRVQAVHRGDLQRTLAFVGELRASEAVEVSSKIPGRIEKILVNMGDKVGEGDLLVMVDDTELKAQIEEAKASISVYQASIAKAEAEQKNAQALLERKEKLAADKLVTPQELDNARTALSTATASVEVAKSQVSQARAQVKLLRSQFSEAKIKAPFSGYVDARYLDPGAVVSPGTPILKLMRKEPIVARFQVEERAIGEIRGKMAGGPVGVQVEVDAYPGEPFAGTIVRFSPGLQSESRTAVVEAEIPNVDGRLMPSMYCRVKVDFGTRSGVLLVPLAAVIEDITSGAGNGSANAAGNVVKVFRVEKGRAQLVAVTIDWKQDDVAEVSKGLAEGDAVIVEGQGLLSDGAVVKVVGAP
jgi:RND family efflux transporter MFP subunit